ncbi:MAG: sulfatase-like hydrolase/transferase [Thiobacillus sp.]|uniref:sulfatase-like hydrolase/transferase n=1 Tax=Thiobacillus sp. TaxID=924 RepID=UPI002732CB87|nr:sulfatase-like hydrolase/transferase [Thiobacillus sp.]MDP3585360.1 sulfatase-like hydrolase/transferase [Thiobacillus sp.]
MPISNRLAVVICTYNRSASLIETLTSQYTCGYNGEECIDIVVVANNCSDDTLDRLADFFASHPRDNLRLTWIEEPKAGKSYALNAAIAHTTHDVLCFIDDDQTVEAGFLRNLIDGMDAYPDEAIYCGRIWPAWDGSEPSWVHARGDYAIPIRPFPEFDLGSESIVITPKDRYPSGGNIVVRRRVFDAAGLFSVDLGPTGHNLAGGEDHDFLVRAVNKGFAIRYLPCVRQLHAIDAERMSTTYTLRKSFLRTRANFLVRQDGARPHLYMFRKILEHLGSAVFTLKPDRRFFYLVRFAASLGELTGAFERLRHRAQLPQHPLPPDPGMVAVKLLSLVTVACGLIAWFASGDAKWAGLLPAAGVASLGAAALLAKSLANFSQTGPRIREEVLTHYRRYTLYALSRLTAWAFALMLFTGGIGVLIYFMLATALQAQWSGWLAALAAVLGVVGAFALQFVAKLRFNPGLLVASMHYRVSRLYGLWQWMTPARIAGLQVLWLGPSALLFVAASWQLAEEGRAGALIALWATVLFVAGTVAWTTWQPEARLPRARPIKRATAPPNILMIGSDTLRADRLGAMGYRRALTPHIDKLAEQGALFANCYVPCARTAPSLISLLTGTWPHTHGIRDNFVPDKETRLKVDALPQLLKARSYRTAALSDWCGADMGKFSFGFEHTDLPEDQWNLKYLIRQGPKDLRLYLSLFLHNRLGRLLLPELYYLGGVPLTEPLGKRARRLVSRLASGAEPFFLNVFYSTTHPPFASEWPYYTRFSDPNYRGESKFAMARLTDPFDILRRQGAPKEEFDLDQIIDLYDGCVAKFDDEVGKMLAHLEACGLAENTIVVVYSDHGMEFFEHDSWGQGNSAVGEASPRIPLVIRDPRKPKRGKIDNVVRSIDLAPTLLELVDAPPADGMDGVSLVGCLTEGDDCPERDAFNETGIWITDIPGLPEHHLRYPDLLELIDVPDRERGTLGIKPEYCERIMAAKDRMIRRGRWKLVYQPLEGGYALRLFDLDSDPTCQHDVSATHPDIRDDLWRRSKAFMPDLQV